MYYSTHKEFMKGVQARKDRTSGHMTSLATVLRPDVALALPNLIVTVIINTIASF